MLNYRQISLKNKPKSRLEPSQADGGRARIDLDGQKRGAATSFNWVCQRDGSSGAISRLRQIGASIFWLRGDASTTSAFNSGL